MFKINKKHLILVSIVFFIFAHKVNANLEITEINYNPEVKTNHLWIKIFNNSNDEVDLTAWSVADYDGTSWHYHAINADGSSILDSNSYAVVAKASSSTIGDFKSKNPDISESLFYGNLTIESEGVLGLSNDKKTIISNKSYGGAIILPDLNTNNSNSNDETNNVTTNSTSSSSLKEDLKVYKISTKIISPKIVTAGIPFIIEHETTGTKKEKVIFGRFNWNFGDGMKKEISISDPFEYTYQYSGEYVLTLSYYDSTFDIKPDASDRIVIKVVPSGVIVSSVGSWTDPFIEIENNSSYEISLNKWVLKGAVHSFVIPDGMVILPNKKLKLSPKITGFGFNDLSYINIIDSGGQIFTTYPKQNVSRVKYSTSTNTENNVVKSDIFDNSKLKDSEEIINLNDLEANVVDSDGLGGLNNIFYYWLGLILIITIGVTTTILIRRRKEYPDYIEGGISAKDMTIIE